MNNPSLSEIPMHKYSLAYPYVDAIEVTLPYVYSLPTAGAILQRFGEQVEILHPGPNQKKIYAGLGEYLIHFPDMNGNPHYTVLSQAAFKGLFSLAPAMQEETISEAKSQPPALEEPKPTKKQKRLKELQEVDTVSLEAPLSNEVE